MERNENKVRGQKKAISFLLVLVSTPSVMDFPYIPLFPLVNNLHFQEFQETQKHPYKAYGDRNEGIIPKNELVSDKFVLISTAMQNVERTVPGTFPKSYNLGFYLKDSARVRIRVTQYTKAYKMERTRRDYPPGSHSFSWPSTIPADYNIGLGDLLPLAETRISGMKVIIPILLYSKRPRTTDISDLSYEFGFVPYQGITILKVAIYDSLGQGTSLFSTTLKDLPKDRVFYVRWHGKDQNNKKVLNNLLTLNVTATFKPPPGSSNYRTVTRNFAFNHVPDILKKLFRP